MKPSPLLILLALCAGCGEIMTNEQIIAEHKKCETAGMGSWHYENSMSAHTRLVKCVPKEVSDGVD